MNVRGFGYTNIGTVREDNEDSYLVDEELALFIVCDGMGGHVAGQVASQATVDFVHKFISAGIGSVTDARSLKEKRAQMLSLVHGAIEAACGSLYHKSLETHGRFRGMGTTITLLIVQGDLAVVGHVGHSRLYLKRLGMMHQLTHDHTVARAYLEQGLLTPEQFAKSVLKHTLTRSVGTQEHVQVECFPFEILPGDVCFLCSDGASNSVGDPAELAELFDKIDIDTVAEVIGKTALRRDGSDNITCVTVSIENVPENRDIQARRCSELNLKTETLLGVFLFRDFTLQELLAVLELVWVRDCEIGEIIVVEETFGNQMFIILEGTVAVQRQGNTIADLKAGNHFGEMALIQDAPRSASVVATEKSRLLFFDRDAFKQLVAKDKSLGVKLLQRMAEEFSARLRRTNEKLKEKE